MKICGSGALSMELKPRRGQDRGLAGLDKGSDGKIGEIGDGRLIWEAGDRGPEDSK